MDTRSRRRRLRITPAGLRGPDAARFIGVSPATWQRLVAAAKVPAPVKLAGCVLWPRQELEAWLAAGAPSADEWRARKADVMSFQS